MRDRGCFHCLRCFLKMSFPLHQASGYLTTERGWSIVCGCLLENERVWFPLPPENKREHFPLDRVAICVLTTLSGEATWVGLVLH